MFYLKQNFIMNLKMKEISKIDGKLLSVQTKNWASIFDNSAP